MNLIRVFQSKVYQVWENAPYKVIEIVSKDRGSNVTLQTLNVNNFIKFYRDRAYLLNPLTLQPTEIINFYSSINLN